MGRDHSVGSVLNNPFVLAISEMNPDDVDKDMEQRMRQELIAVLDSLEYRYWAIKGATSRVEYLERMRCLTLLIKFQLSNFELNPLNIRLAKNIKSG